MDGRTAADGAGGANSAEAEITSGALPRREERSNPPLTPGFNEEGFNAPDGTTTGDSGRGVAGIAAELTADSEAAKSSDATPAEVAEKSKEGAKALAGRIALSGSAVSASEVTAMGTVAITTALAVPSRETK